MVIQVMLFYIHNVLTFLQLMPCTAGLTGAMCVQLLAQGKKTNSPIRVSKQDLLDHRLTPKPPGYCK